MGGGTPGCSSGHQTEARARKVGRYLSAGGEEKKLEVPEAGLFFFFSVLEAFPVWLLGGREHFQRLGI